MKQPGVLLKTISLLGIFYGIGMIDIGVEKYMNTPRILSLVAGGLILLASILGWIKKEIFWIICTMAFFSSFLLLEIRFVLTNQKWYGLFEGLLPLVFSLFLLQSNVRALFLTKQD